MGKLDSMLDELNNMENSITLRDENGEEVKLYVLEETKLNGESYLLASDTKDGDGECYLLRDTSKPEDAEAAYEFVDDDGELEYMSKVFAELMSDLGVDIE
ncbi:DUF1292 domain-containing protein [Clostridium fessum]|uniref:DUF1292 domain-containing protein n=1 Tax=Clostridium fessum TaxID=2126740 RepID=UPI002E787222|nr:DUF1292 domain-containing protein [Clostridium fessum]